MKVKTANVHLALDLSVETFSVSFNSEKSSFTYLFFLGRFKGPMLTALSSTEASSSKKRKSQKWEEKWNWRKSGPLLPVLLIISPSLFVSLRARKRSLRRRECSLGVGFESTTHQLYSQLLHIPSDVFFLFALCGAKIMQYFKNSSFSIFP